MAASGFASAAGPSGFRRTKKDLESSGDFNYDDDFNYDVKHEVARNVCHNGGKSQQHSYNMGKFSQFHLLLWKNYVLQKRKKIVTCIEIGLPLILSIILILIRQKVVSREVTEPTMFTAFRADLLPPLLDPMQGTQDRACPPVPEVMLHPPFRAEGLTPKLCSRQPRSLFFPWRVYYTPKHNLTDQLMNLMADQLGRDNVSDVYGFNSEKEMVDKIVYELDQDCPGHVNCSTLAGVVFEFNFTSDQKQLPEKMRYKLRFSATPRNKNFGYTSDLGVVNLATGWMTEVLFPATTYVGPRARNHTSGGAPGYYDEGFLSVQKSIDFAIFRMHNASDVLQNVSLPIRFQRFPYPPYNDDIFVLVIQTQFPMVILLSLIFCALMIVKDVVHEKERRLKESMKMMGLNNWLHWCAWFTKYFIFISISMVIMTMFLCIPMTEYGSIISYSDWSLLLTFLILYSIATINFSFMISTFFSKANSAAAAGGVLFFASYIPYFFLDPHYSTMTWSSKMGCCLVSNVAMALGARVIGMFEGTGAGVQWSNIAQGVSVDDNFAMLHVLIMLLVDAIIYAVITWYVEAVFPGEFGIPQPWYFPFTRSYWYGTVPQGDDVSAMLPQYDYQEDELVNLEFMEKDPVDLRPGIRMQQLRKVFGKGQKRKVAVAGTTLKMYEGQITALLGHNGAGKTTTMSMLTGFIPATSGTAVVNGYDIRDDIQGVRNSLGLCPQHDVLFDHLTVEEHLIFFAKLKGMKGSDVKEEVSKMLHATGLKDKKDALSRTLSGGMKRKLSVGIALIGGSKVVILDEPTSGMDPNARRQTWDLLQQHREGRTMVLSTHFMDEADLLGDRIAIMAGGIIQCCGSSLFLKNKYGAGYHMVIVKNPNCDVRCLTDLVLSHVPSAQLESNISAELSFILPSESCDRFSGLFREMEARKEEFGIDGYGASITTMEEVFMKVGEEVDSTLKEKLQQKIALTTGARPAEPLFNESLKKNTGVSLLCQQFYAMLKKRMLHTWRNWLVTLAQLLVPLLLTIASLSVIKTLPQPQDSPPLTLNLDKYGENTIVYSTGIGYSHLSEADSVAKMYAQQFHGQDSALYLNNVTTYASNPLVNQYLIAKGEWDLATYNSQYMLAATFNKTDTRHPHLLMTAHFNDVSYHTPAIALSMISNAFLQAHTNQNHSITTVNHPLPRTFKDQYEDVLDHKFEGYTVAITVIFGMSFLSSSFILFLIKERSVRAKHIQFVSGVSSTTFWSATFFWDLINYIFPAMSIVIAIAAFDVQAYVTDNHLAYVILLFSIYAWAVLPFMYILSFIFTIPSSGFVWITMFNILSGAATMLVVDILEITSLDLVYLSKILDWGFLALFPNYCLGQGLSDFYTNYLTISVCETPEVQLWCKFPSANVTFGCCKGHCGDSCYDYTDNYLSMESGGIGRMLVFLSCQGVVYWAILALIQSGLLRCLWYCLTFNRSCKSNDVLENSIHSFGPEDDDVAKERQRIMNTPIETLMTRDTLVLTELSKVYNHFQAVDSLSVGIPQGECFGLLGINGAGKTTTFKMLTGDETVSRGNAYLVDYDIKSNIKAVQHHLGYCPQFDALIDQLTGRETLRMFARLRGVCEEQIPGVVESLLAALLLEDHADQLVCNFSGGNKRKLSTAVALVGDPPIIFLDEPTTGMDPVARRLLWDTLSRVRASGRTLVLTSHSMEECEALCTRIAIMVNGQFKCLGSTQHLKYKFGEGYTLIVKVAYPTDGNQPDILPLMEYIEQRFPHSILKDIHQGMMHFHITRHSTKWADIFETMEKVKYRFNIEDYSVSQTTLEQVFMNFARSQVAPREDKGKPCAQIRACMAKCCCTCCASEESEEEDLINVLDHNNPSV